MAGQTGPEVELVFEPMTLGKSGKFAIRSPVLCTGQPYPTARVPKIDDAGVIPAVLQKFGPDEIETAHGYVKKTSEEYLAELK